MKNYFLFIINFNPKYNIAAEIIIIKKSKIILLKKDLSSVKVIRAPINNAMHVKPKENPALPGNIFEIATNVTGIVKLNKNKPNIPKIGIFTPK